MMTIHFLQTLTSQFELSHQFFSTDIRFSIVLYQQGLLLRSDCWLAKSIVNCMNSRNLKKIQEHTCSSCIILFGA